MEFTFTMGGHSWNGLLSGWRPSVIDLLSLENTTPATAQRDKWLAAALPEARVLVHGMADPIVRWAGGRLVFFFSPCSLLHPLS